MKVGFAGLPEVGKTTLFNALTRQEIALNTYGGVRDEIHLGTVPVPDERFDFAVQACKPKKEARATVDITDGGARVQVNERKEKFGTDFFAGVRNMDALVLVLRAFGGDTPPEPTGGVNPARDAQRIQHGEFPLWNRQSGF